MPLPVSRLVVCLNFCIKVTLRVVLLQWYVSLNGKGTTISQYSPAPGNNDSFVPFCSLNCRGHLINGVSLIE